jgi:futalosine hydrolase
MPIRAGSGAPTLLLVPTRLEARELAELGGFEPGLALEKCCGFGPIAAAARTSALIERLSPARILLLGIAASLDVAALPVGSAVRVARVAIDGLETAGFAQAPGIRETIDLAIPRAGGSTGADGRLLLTVLAPSDSLAQTAERRHRFPDAIAEDMEGYGVAVACALAAVPLVIVRGISNAAGDRDRSGWKIRSALAAARAKALDLLREGEWDLAR